MSCYRVLKSSNLSKLGGIVPKQDYCMTNQAEPRRNHNNKNMALVAFERELMKIQRALKTIFQGGQRVFRIRLEWFKFAMIHNSHLTCPSFVNMSLTLSDKKVDFCDILLKVGQMSSVNTNRKLPSKVYIGSFTMNRQVELAGVVEHK